MDDAMGNGPEATRAHAAANRSHTAACTPMQANVRAERKSILLQLKSYMHDLGPALPTKAQSALLEDPQHRNVVRQYLRR